MARWAGDVNRLNEAHKSTELDKSAVTAGRIQNQAAKKLEVAEWKTQVKNRMRTAEANVQKAEAEAGVAVFENENKKRVFNAEIATLEANADTAEAESKHATDLAAAKVASEKQLARQRRTAGDENLAEGRLADAKALKEAGGTTDQIDLMTTVQDVMRVTGGKGSVASGVMTTHRKADLAQDEEFAALGAKRATYDQMKMITQTSDASPGLFFDVQRGLGSFISTIPGMDNIAEALTDVSNMQQLGQVFNQEIAMKVLLGGRGISNEDAALIMKSLPSRFDTPASLKKFLKVAEATLGHQFRRQEYIANRKSGYFDGQNWLADRAEDSYYQVYGRDFSPVGVIRGKNGNSPYTYDEFLKRPEVQKLNEAQKVAVWKGTYVKNLREGN